MVCLKIFIVRNDISTTVKIMFNQKKIHRVITMFCIGINEILGILYTDSLLNKGELLSDDGVNSLEVFSQPFTLFNYLSILFLMKLLLTQIIYNTVMVVRDFFCQMVQFLQRQCRNV